MINIEKEYLKGIIKDDIRFAPADKKYEYIAELEMALTQHVLMIDKIGDIIGGLNDVGVKIDNKRLYHMIVKLAAKKCNVNTFQ